MKLSACWITKNEESRIARSIQSVAAAVDELIVADTGSTDNTVKIAEANGASVFHFDWVNDFSAARNFSFSHATGDIILMMDADEWYEPALTQSSRPLIEGFFKSGKTNVVMVRRHNIDPATELTIDSDHMQRIFLNKNGFHFENAIHEVPAFTPPAGPEGVSTDALCLLHDGYAADMIKAKLRRNLRLLELEAANSKDQNHKATQMAYILREAAGTGQAEKAVRALTWLLQNPKPTYHAFASHSHLMAVSLNFGVRMAATNGHFVPQSLLENTWIKDLPARFSRSPITHVARVFFESVVKQNDRYLLAHLDEDVAEANRHVGASVFDDVSLYTKTAVHLYENAALASMYRGQKAPAFDYVAKALTARADNAGDGLAPSTLALFLQCVRGLPAADIILFLNNHLNITKTGNLNLLLASMCCDGFADVYKYYVKQALDAGKAKKADFWYLLTLMGRSRDAAEAAAEAAAETPVEVVSQAVFLAAICGDDASLLQDFVHLMQEDHRAAAEAFYASGSLGAEHGDVFFRNFRLIAFAKGRIFARRFYALFDGLGHARLMAALEYYRGSALYAEFFADYGAPADVQGPALLHALTEMHLLAGNYALALSKSVRYAEAVQPDAHALYVAGVAADAGDEPTARAARDFTARYAGLVERKTTCEAFVNSGAAVAPDAKGTQKALAGCTSATLKEKAGPAGLSMPENYCLPVLLYAEKAQAAGALAAAADAYAYVLPFSRFTAPAAAGLAAVMRKAGNSALADELAGRAAACGEMACTEFSSLLKTAAKAGETATASALKTAFASLPAAQQAAITSFLDGSDTTPDAYFLANTTFFLQNADALAAFAASLADAESLQVLRAAAANLLSLDTASLAAVSRGGRYIACYPTTAPMPKNATYVETGADNAIPAWFFTDMCGIENFCRIYSYMPSQSDVEKREDDLLFSKNVTVAAATAAAKAGEAAPGPSGEALPAITLDEAVDGQIDFLRVNAPAGTRAALEGAAAHIRQHRPTLALLPEQHFSDVLDIPAWLNETAPGYRYHLRYHGGPLLPSGLVLLCVPPAESG